MDKELKDKIETLVVAQVLTLAKAIESEKRAKGAGSTSHYIPDAVRLIRNERKQILSLLSQNNQIDNQAL